MPLVIDAITSISNRAVLTVIKRLWDNGDSLPFESSYLVADDYTSKYLYPGMVVSKDPVNGMYVPANEIGSYGAYSYYAYAAGILYSLTDHTFESQIVAPATRAAVIEDYCYIFGGTLGVIPDDVKNAVGMKLIQWD